MEKFDSNRGCPKCGFLSAQGVFYHEAGECELEAAEHMHRTCTRCSYEWVEAPLS